VITEVIGSGTASDGLPSHQQVPQPPTRLSTRANKSTWQSTKYKGETWLAEVYAESDEKLFQQDEHLAYLAALALDMDTGLLDVTSPMIYAAARKRKDPDTPDYALAMSGVDKEEYLVAMTKEITELKAKTCGRSCHVLMRKVTTFCLRHRRSRRSAIRMAGPANSRPDTVAEGTVN
jgi:hypothetical protein